MKQTIDHAGLAVIASLVEKYDLQDLLGALADVATERAQEAGDHRLRAVATAIYHFHAELAARPMGDACTDQGEPSYMNS